MRSVESKSRVGVGRVPGSWGALGRSKKTKFQYVNPRSGSPPDPLFLAPPMRIKLAISLFCCFFWALKSRIANLRRDPGGSNGGPKSGIANLRRDPGGSNGRPKSEIAYLRRDPGGSNGGPKSGIAYLRRDPGGSNGGPKSGIVYLRRDPGEPKSGIAYLR